MPQRRRKQPEPTKLHLGDLGSFAVLDLGLFHPRVQRPEMDPGILRDLIKPHTGLAVPRDPNNIVNADSLGYGLDIVTFPAQHLDLPRNRGLVAGSGPGVRSSQWLLVVDDSRLPRVGRCRGFGADKAKPPKMLSRAGGTPVANSPGLGPSVPSPSHRCTLTSSSMRRGPVKVSGTGST